MKSILFSQERLPMELLCLPRDEPVQSSTLDANRVSPQWVMGRPTGTKLSKNSFSKSLQLNKDNINEFIVSQGDGPPWYFINPSTTSLKSFCLGPCQSHPLHPRIDLEKTYEVPNDSLGLCIFLATSSGHPLLLDTKHYGACFVVEKCYGKDGAFDLRHLCSLKYQQCWERHENCIEGEGCDSTVTLLTTYGFWDNKMYISSGMSYIVPVNGLSANLSLTLGKWYRPKTRRPPNAANWGLPHRVFPLGLVDLSAVYLLWTVGNFVLYWAWFLRAVIQSTAFDLSDPLFVIATISLILGFPFGLTFSFKLMFGHAFWYRSYTHKNAFFIESYKSVLSCINTLERLKELFTQSRVWRLLVFYRPRFTLRRRTYRWHRTSQDLAPDVHPWTGRAEAADVALSWREYCFFTTEDNLQHTEPNDEAGDQTEYEFLSDNDAGFLRRLKVALTRTPD